MSNQKLVEAFDAVFEFQVGDIVCHRINLEAIHHENAINAVGAVRGYARIGTPHKFLVMERRAVQCHGGLQCFYACRVTAGADVDKLVHFADHEIVSLAEVKAAFDAGIEPRKPGKDDDL